MTGPEPRRNQGSRAAPRPHRDPASAPRGETALFWIAFAALAIAFVVLKRAFGVLICDDAYITLSHARSWVSGLGPIMSARNPVCATSTPLHTAQLALAGWLSHGSDYPRMAYAADLIWDLIGFFFFLRIALRGLGLPRPFALAALAAYAFSVNLLAVSAYGMETSMYAALALAGAWFAFYSEGSLGLAAVCLLAPLARPEGILLPAVLIPLRSLADRGKLGSYRTLYVTSACAALGFAGFFLFYHFAYGRWLPHSILAKRLEIHVGFFEGLKSWLLNVFYKGPCLGGTTAVTLGNLASVAAAARGFRRSGERAPWYLLAWPALYFLFFTATRSSYILFTWYYLPVLPFLILFLMDGIARLGARIPRAAAWVCLFAFIVYAPAQTFRQHLPAKHRFAEAAREGRYREAARIVDSLAAPGETPTVMMDEVGAMGYFSHARILDTHGLLSPEALPYLGGREGYFLRMAALQDQVDPDWIVGLRLVKDEGLLYPGEDGLYSGYGPARILRLPPHPYNLEMWRRLPPD